ncbi:HNH endonuclease [Streptomyces sp. ISL-96]|uniref:HNH endonuclease signature motif containing protein n=1 Tax=Streptomyces sp. ISL-96 TaxID=2819191 RepID=UPI001BE6A974|nr:HNH endonuclease signature motif containing protein [Streptomyces sp. ISL-96]MBT2491277.1 HNH endonuclease [Streptomyces sp. ISL-96]
MSQAQRYTRERLAEAAGCCANIDEVISFLETRPYGRLRRYLFERFAHFGIDVSHFQRRGYHKGGPRPGREQLSEAVAAAVSIADILRRLGRPDSESQRALLKLWMAQDAIPTEHLLGQGHQRGKPSLTPARRAADVLTKHNGKRRTKATHLRRALFETGVPEQCDECGTGPMWLGKPMTLEVDHISGDWSDDRAENLRLLCPNCHAITNTWCRGGRRRTS